MIKDFHRYINRTGMALLLLPTLFSCSDNALPESPGTVNTERVPLQVAGASTGTGIGVQTRTEGRTELISGSIGMFMKADATAGYTALDNQRFTYATPFWQADEQILLGTPAATLAACYPYAAGQVNPVVLRSRQYTAAGDFHYVNFRADKRTSVIRLDLSRVYSRIVFNFKANADYTGAGKVTAIRLEGSGIVPAATLDMLDASVNVYGKSVRDVLVPVTGLDVAEITGLTTQFTTTAAGTADCLMIPHLLQGDINLTVTVDGGKMTGKVTATQLCGITGILTEGVKYEVNITVNQLKGLEIGTIKTTDWDSQSAWSDEVTFEPIMIHVPKNEITMGVHTCTSDDKDVLSSLFWANGNLRQQNDDGTGPTLMAGPNEYGHYYTWKSTYTGNTSQNNTDPCSRLDANKYGINWRTPSKDEMDALCRCSDKQLTNGGMWFMNNTTGLFLPAAGTRTFQEGSGTAPSRDAVEYANYWTSDIYLSEPGKGYGMGFYSAHAQTFDYYGTFGFTVRCVKGIRQ